MSELGRLTPAQARKLFEPTEREWQTQVRRLAQQFGWADYCIWNSQHSPAGWPDLVLLREEGDMGAVRMIIMELKREGKRLSPKQVFTLELLKGVPGIEVHGPVYPSQIEEVIEWLS